MATSLIKRVEINGGALARSAIGHRTTTSVASRPTFARTSSAASTATVPATRWTSGPTSRAYLSTKLRLGSAKNSTSSQLRSRIRNRETDADRPPISQLHSKQLRQTGTRANRHPQSRGRKNYPQYKEIVCSERLLARISLQTSPPAMTAHTRCGLSFEISITKLAALAWESHFNRFVELLATHKLVEA